MNKKHAKRRRDIKTKLMAAICMLLVSSIMMVSTTYAWFTLSTAPEVTGINTAVGANGNLEMALQPVGGIDDIEESAVGDSLAATEVRNITWGNLVDLGYTLNDLNYYGLDKIALNPSKLNVVDGKLEAAMLQTPSYGADGRVAKLEKNTVTSTYDFTNKGFPTNNSKGVRAVGTASGMTDRQLDYRNYTAEANTAISQAKNLAANSLNQNGASLANIAIAHVLNDGATHDKKDVDALMAIINDLLGTTDDEGNVTKTGVIQYIENAYRSLIVAYGASAAMAKDEAGNGMTDEEYAVFESVVLAAKTLEDAIDELGGYGVELPSGLATPIEKLNASKAAIAASKTELGQLPTEGITWNQLLTPMQRLVNIEKLTLLGFPVSDAKNHISEIAQNAQNLVLTMPTGGGIYADIADHCGNYQASVTLMLNLAEMMGGATTGGEATPFNATMAAKSDVNPGYLNILGGVVSEAGSPAGAGTTMPISDFYGYVIDLAFRTNAASSNLLLQTLPEGRIYDNANSTEETMGHGASMTFTTAATGFTLDQMKDLMSAIRLVFFDTDTNEVFAYAKLDLSDGNYTTVGGNTITAYLYLYETSADGTSYVTATAEQIAAAKAGTEGAETLYAKAEGSEEYTPVAQAAIADDGAYFVKKDIAAGETLIKEQTEAVIMALTQNTAQALSVLVYLDGENVTNADVAIDAQSMTGTLNLQFSSSANLVPMNYTPLMNQGGNDEDGE